jgi:hypothetical protein
MALAIGSLSPNAWRGTLQGPRKTVETFTRPGVAGSGLVVDAARAPEVEIETDFLGSLADCQTFRTTAELMVGTVVSCSDQWGASWDDVAVIAVESQITATAGTYAGVCRTRWRLIAEG